MISDEIHEAAKAIGAMNDEEMREYLKQRLMESGGPMMVLSATICMLNFSGELIRDLDIRSVCQDIAGQESHEYLATATAMVCVLLDAHEQRMATDAEYAKLNEYTKKILGEQITLNSEANVKKKDGPCGPMFG